MKSPIFNPTIAIISQDILSSASNWDNLPPHAKLAAACSGSSLASWLCLRRQMLPKCTCGSIFTRQKKKKKKKKEKRKNLLMNDIVDDYVHWKTSVKKAGVVISFVLMFAEVGARLRRTSGSF